MNGTPQHPAERRLQRFMHGEPLPREETRSIVRHLLTGCPRCLEFTGRLWALGELPADLAKMAAELMAPFRRDPASTWWSP